MIIDGTSQAPSSDGSIGVSVQIEIDGTNAGSRVDGLTFTGSGGEVRGQAINRFESDGIVLRGAAAVAVEDNLIGTDNTGETDQGNGGSGISVTTAGHFITRNVISGNGAHGVNVSGSSASRTYISGNYIGTNGDGETGLGNDDSGVCVTGAPDVQTAENVISGNGRHGVNVSAADAAVVLDNLIGSDATGAVDLGNGASGMAIASASNALVAGNVISGNGTQGVNITGATGSSKNILAFNSIINNGGHGVQLNGAGVTATILRFNVIGTDADGDADLGNGGSGVHVGQNASSNLVDENFIAFSGGDGVTIISPGATGNTVWENAIFSNTGLGIDLGADGVTANDATDADTGSNNLQNFPLLSAAARNETEIGVHGTLNGNADTEYIIDFYSNSACDGAGNGEGEVWLGFSRDATDATGSADITSFFPATELAGNFITATATAPDDSTSEFSACAEAATLPDLVLPEGVDVDEGDTVEYEVTLAEQPSADVTVYLLSSADTVATATPASLPFTTANWETPQTVTVAGVQDHDANDDSSAIHQVVVHEGGNYIAGAVGVAVADDDLPELTLSAGSVSVTEGGSVDYTMQLAVQPTGDVAVSLSPTAGDVDSATLSSTTHTFTTSNWDTTHTITVGGVSDDDASNQVLLVNHTATFGGDEHALAGLFIIVVDDDLPELTLPQLPAVVAEGSTAAYQAVLAAEPTADVTVTLTSTDPEAATTRPATLDFTTAEWNTAQTVTVEAVVDDDGSNEAVGILHTATIGGDDYFLGLRIVLVADSDTAPYFIDGATAVRSISEISTPGTDAGPPVTALDPDFGPGSYGLSGDDASPFKIDSVNGQISLADGVALDYENPIDSDGGNDYEVTVTVTDSAGETDSIAVTISVLDDPELLPGEPSPYTNNIPPAAPTGLMVTAEDLNTRLSVSWSPPDDTTRSPNINHDVRYRTEGMDWTLIDYTPIVANRVVLEDLERGSCHEVQVRAQNARGRGGWSGVRSASSGSSANDPPCFSEGSSASRVVEENLGAGADVGEPVSANDPETSDTLTYSLSSSGTDHDSFGIGRNGQIIVAAGGDLDFETRSSYLITVSINDGKDAVGNADTTVDDTIAVTISVTNIEEPGTVSFGSTRPQVGTELTATLTDPDGSVTNETWVWESSSDQTTWTAITGATSASYTAVSEDVGNYLRATVSYTDGEGGGKSAERVSDDTVQAALVTNEAPAAPTGLTATAGDGQVTLGWSDPADASITSYDVRPEGGRRRVQ